MPLITAHTRTAIAAFLCLAATLVPVRGGAGQATVSQGEWRVIVHPLNPLRSIARVDLERIYRGKSGFWTDGRAILPINLPGTDPLRHLFVKEVLHDTEENLTIWWNRQYFQGIAPPAVLQSSKAVRAYVALTPNAIGYVYAADVDASVAPVDIHVD